jgi:hypothetical protein
VLPLGTHRERKEAGFVVKNGKNIQANNARIQLGKKFPGETMEIAPAFCVDGRSQTYVTAQNKKL